MKRTLLWLFAVAAVAAACQKPENGNNPDDTAPVSGDKTFKATLAPLTKVTLEDGLALSWTKADKVSVFDGAGNKQFRAQGSGATAEILGSAAAADTYYAIFPYDASATLSGSIVQTKIATEQTASAGGSDIQVLSAAKSDGDNLAFSPVSAVLCFSLDEDAYNRLSVYFDHFKARLSKDSQSMGEEVMSDLESRIAELFDQGIGGAAYRVVDLDLVSRVVNQLGMPDGSAEPTASASAGSQAGNTGGGPSTGSGTGPDFSYSGEKGDSKKRLFRDPDNKTIGGVCSGMAAFLNIDITIVRIIILLAILLWGSGLLVYLVLWVVVPLAKTPAEKCEMRGLEPTAENMARFSDYKRR